MKIETLLDLANTFLVHMEGMKLIKKSEECLLYKNEQQEIKIELKKELTEKAEEKFPEQGVFVYQLTGTGKDIGNKNYGFVFPEDELEVYITENNANINKIEKNDFIAIDSYRGDNPVKLRICKGIVYELPEFRLLRITGMKE
jgi:hypothetical protein